MNKIIEIDEQGNESHYESVEEAFAHYSREFKNEHPILHWIDNSLFKGKGIGSYSAHYAIAHPWVLIADGWREIKFAYQRVIRGWDDRVVWSIDWHLTEMMPQWLERLKETKQGTPIKCFDGMEYDEHYGYTEEQSAIAKERWEKVLQEIVDGFIAARVIQEYDFTDDDYDETMEVFNKGFEAFREYFFNLWD